MRTPFKVGHCVTHMADPFKEKYEIVEMVALDLGDGCGRMIIKSERTSELMPLIISRIGLAGWKKV